MQKNPRSRQPYIFAIAVMALLLVGFTVYFKGDVKAAVKVWELEFSLEAQRP